MFESLNLGTEAMRASQGALGVIGHNIANINTEGYSRQRPILETNVPQDLTPGQRGTGVRFTRIQRLTDTFTKLQINVENRKLGEYEIQSDILDQVETILNEPNDNGLQTAISEFFSAFHSLGNSPEDFGSRSVAAQKGMTLAEKLNFVSTSLKDVQSQVDELVTLKITEVNDISDRIAALNNRVASAEAGGAQDANDLRDERELLLKKLNKIINVNSYEDENNLMIVETQGAVLVAGTRSIHLGTVSDINGHLIPSNESSGVPVTILGGEFKGLLDARDSFIDNAVEDLDELSLKLVEEVNRIHSRGTVIEGHKIATSSAVVNQPDETIVYLQRTGAIDFLPENGSFWLAAYDDTNGNLLEEHEIQINPYADTTNDIINAINTAFSSGRVQARLNSGNQLEIYSASGVNFQFVSNSEVSDDSDYLLAMGLNTYFEGNSSFTINVRDDVANDLSLVSAGRSISPGDNRTALEIANLKDELTMNNNSASFDGFFGAIVSQAGTNAQTAARNEDNQDSLIALLEQRLASTTGVSLDEEASNMLIFQRMFQAAAKYVSTMDSVLNTLINGL